MRMGFLMEEGGEVAGGVRGYEMGREGGDEKEGREGEGREEVIEEMGEVVGNVGMVGDK